MLSRRELLRALPVTLPFLAAPLDAFAALLRDDLEAAAAAGLEQRLGHAPPVYYRQVEREVRLISDRGLRPRFQAAAAVATSAREHGVLLGPGRSSTPSSVVAW